jgi:hypothetical protein
MSAFEGNKVVLGFPSGVRVINLHEVLVVVLLVQFSLAFPGYFFSIPPILSKLYHQAFQLVSFVCSFFLLTIAALAFT